MSLGIQNCLEGIYNDTNKVTACKKCEVGYTLENDKCQKISTNNCSSTEKDPVDGL